MTAPMDQILMELTSLLIDLQHFTRTIPNQPTALDNSVRACIYVSLDFRTQRTCVRACVSNAEENIQIFDTFASNSPRSQS